jgi:hypothetical protein
MRDSSPNALHCLTAHDAPVCLRRKRSKVGALPRRCCSLQQWDAQPQEQRPIDLQDSSERAVCIAVCDQPPAALFACVSPAPLAPSLCSAKPVMSKRRGRSANALQHAWETLRVNVREHLQQHLNNSSRINEPWPRRDS